MNTNRGAAAFSSMMRAASTIALATFFIVPSYAQGTGNLAQEDQAQDAGSGGSRIQEGGEIVVTALRRDTRLQDTPLAISAVTGANLERGGNVSMTDLTRNAPSLVMTGGGPGARRVILRGVRASGEPTVGVYFDESPVSGSVGTSSDAGGSTPELRLAAEIPLRHTRQANEADL